MNLILPGAKLIETQKLFLHPNRFPLPHPLSPVGERGWGRGQNDKGFNSFVFVDGRGGEKDCVTVDRS